MNRETAMLLVSTPLHLLDAMILAETTFKESQTVMILLDQKDTRYYDALKQQPDTPFSAIYILGIKPARLFAKLRTKRRNRQKLSEIITKHRPKTIITGNDRKIEFDYAMQLANSIHPDLSGGYMDDGLHSYIPQQLKWFQYTFIDTWIQKLFLGRKTAIPRLLGTGKSVKDVFLFRPDLAHEALKKKHLYRLDTQTLTHPPLSTLLHNLAGLFSEKDVNYPPDATLLILPHPSVKKQIPGYEKIIDKLFALPGPLLVKLHPRETQSAEYTRCQKDPKCQLLPSEVAMELLLFTVSPKKVYSMRSSALLTLSWLLPHAAFYNIRTGTLYDTLFAKFGIENIDPEEIK